MYLDRRYVTKSPSEAREGKSAALNTPISEDSAAQIWDDKRLHGLQAAVMEQPRQLSCHMERIHYCFRENLLEQLFGAMIDLLMVLDGRGQAISLRLLNATQAKLSASQKTALLDYLAHPAAEKLERLANDYSLFRKKPTDRTPSKPLVKDTEPDALQQARDYIIAGNFTEARELLERAVLAEPARTSLHRELTELYHSIHQVAEFNRMFAKLKRLGIALPDEWYRLNGYFKGLTEYR